MSRTMMTPMLAALCLLTVPTEAPAQTRWRVDPTSSLAWWQIAPHMDHLWATTCPADPSWRPGEGRSAGWSVNMFTAPKTAYVLDTAVVPLYPRYWVLPVCAEAVRGEVVVADTVRWRGVRGAVAVSAAALVTGDAARDAYARDAVVEANRFPLIRFTVDSLVDVTRQADTIRATALGILSLRGVSQRTTAAVQAWPHAGGLRVLARFSIPASALVPEYGMSRFALGLGVGLRIWRYVFAGVDVVLRPQEATPR